MPDKPIFALCFWVMFSILIGVSDPSAASGPLETLQQKVDQAINVLTDPRYTGNDDVRESQQENRLWEILLGIFDFREFSRRVLARNWLEFSSEQQDEFVEYFSQFLRNYYLSRLQRRYKNESVNYLSEKIVDDSRAVVKVEVLWNKRAIPVDIWMLKRNGNWKVYDLSFLGISAVKNYRAQFNALMETRTPVQVIAMVKEKADQSKKEIETMSDRSFKRPNGLSMAELVLADGRLINWI